MNLESASRQVAPVYGGGLDLNRPEDQLLEAFQKARQALFGTLPKNAKLDMGEAKLAADLISQQIRVQQPAIMPKLQARQDLDVPNAISLGSDKCRQYYIGKYIAASQGLGGYPAGLAREAVQAGAMSKQDYLDGIEVRLRAYSDIIFAEKNGHLTHLVNGEQLGGDSIIQTAGTGVLARPGMSGMGIAITPAIILGIIAISIVAGITYYAVQSNRTELTVAMMTRNCEAAIKAGNDRAIKYCNEFAKEAAGGGPIKDILGSAGQEQLLKYLGYAGAAYLAILLLPTLTQSVLSTQEVVREQKR